MSHTVKFQRIWTEKEHGKPYNLSDEEAERTAYFQIASGETVLIDAEDYDRLTRYTWRAGTNRGGLYVKGGPNHSMGRFLLGLKPGDPRHAHHVNENHADMRKRNLRAVSPEQHRKIHEFDVADDDSIQPSRNGG